MAGIMSLSRTRLVNKCPLYYPFGGKIARNVLQDYKGAKKEVKVWKNKMSVWNQRIYFVLFLYTDFIS